MPVGLTPPKPISLNYNLANPYAQPKPTNTGIVSTSFYQKPPALGKPVTVGNVRVDTTQPVIVQGEPVKPAPVNEEQQGFWAKRTKTQKGLIIGGAIAVIIAVVVLRKKK